MLKEIYNRHSIRNFKKQAVEDTKINELLKAAMQAPTARNLQTWKFIVVKKREALDDMVKLQPYMQMMQKADLAIIVLGDLNINPEPGYLYVDAAAAIENILLEAVNQGLGACWCAIAPKEERIKAFKDYYGLEDNLLPIASIAIGYAAEDKVFIDRYDPSKVRYIR